MRPWPYRHRHAGVPALEAATGLMADQKPGPTIAYAAGVPLMICTIAVLAWVVGLLQPVDSWVSDQRFHFGDRSPTGKVVLVALDTKSLSQFGAWPVSRGVYAKLVDALRELDAGQIALDIDLSAPGSPDDDNALAAALDRSPGKVVLAASTQVLTGSFGEREVVSSSPLPALGEHGRVAGAGLHPDSMTATLAGAADQMGGYGIDFAIRADQIEAIPAADLLSGSVAKERIAGKIVIVGATAAELRDFYQVPRYGPVPGALLVALGTDTLLQNRAVTSPGIWPVALFLAIVALFVGIFSDRIPWTVTLTCLAASGVFLEGVAAAAQVLLSVALETTAADAALLALAIAVTIKESNIRGLLVSLTGRELGNARTILDQVIADSFAGILIVDQRGVVEAASRSAAAMLGGKTEEDLIGKALGDVGPVELEHASRNAMTAMAEGRWSRLDPTELQIKEPTGRKRIFEYVATPSRLSAVTSDHAIAPDRFACSVMLLDVTERREAEARLAYLANFDQTTGLANRRQFTQHLLKVLNANSGGRCAVICFDLDRFKNVNDTLGHRIGDLLLQEVAARVQACMRNNDLVARLGGDEYAVVVTERASDAEINRFAQSLVDRLGQPYELQGRRVFIGASAGVAFPGLTNNGQDLMKNADTALYRAKAEGGNCYRVFEPSMDARLRARQELELDCWDALKRDEFEIYYQPQVDLSEGRITGVEALLRWKHPTRGFVSPVDFIPVAEDTGMIEMLGAWVLKKACSDVVSWPGELKVAVNVSPVQFQRGNLVKTVSEALTASGLPPDRLDLEITESLFVSKNATISAAVGACGGWASASPSTTSAPATPRSAISASSPSRRSRSTSRS